MSKSHSLRLRDVRKVYRLLGECRDLGHDSLTWRTHLLVGLAHLTGAQVGVGGEIHGFLTNRPEVAELFSFGWPNDTGRRLWVQFMEQEDPSTDILMPQILQRLGEGRLAVTRSRRQCVREHEWRASKHFNEYVRPGDLDRALYSFCVLPHCGEDVINVVELHRELGAREFGKRERRLLALVHRELRPLVGYQLVSAKRPSFWALSPRLRQTLSCLLEGDSEKQVALRLGLAESTVHDYVKALYRHFDVNSRGMLLARFVQIPSDGLVNGEPERLPAGWVSG